MPCMCGDLYCPSCGPAQGNSQCPACGRWTHDEFYKCLKSGRVFDETDIPADEHCDKCGSELAESSGCLNPEACDREAAGFAADL